MDDFVFNKRKTKNIIRKKEGTTSSKMQKKLRISCFIFEKNKTIISDISTQITLLQKTKNS